MNERKFVGGIGISNPDKVLFPKSNIKKIDVAEYYEKISAQMMPYLNGRLLSVVRCHDNIEGERFFKKHPTTEKGFVETFQVGEEEYFYLSKPEDIIFQAQMGTLEFHIWGSKTKNIDKPDLMIFDLDPSEDVSIEKLRGGVMLVKELLDELKLKSFLKTSGGKGYHVVVPFTKSKDWTSFSEFSKQIALVLEAKHNDMFTSNIRKDQRHGRIFVDYLRNKKGATCVAPYSLRARENAPISLPIAWNQLDKIKPNEVTISNYTKFLGNPWKDFSSQAQLLR